jgi:riboflavin kinase / FMN adenylyltransferase
MRVYTEPSRLGSIRRPIVMAAGFFDGLHRGHQRVLSKTLKRARDLGGQAWVLTFDIHPLKLLRPEVAPRMLTSTGHKLMLFESLGVDGCLLLPFTRRLADMEPAAFVDWLCGAAPALRELHVGRNWRFGKREAGNVALLRRLGLRRNFSVSAATPVRLGGKTVSSTRIRDAILGGRLGEATRMLGRPFSVLGTVVPGRQVGRQLGFPTANLQPHNEVLPPCGVYAVRARLGHRMLDGVASYGTRPTFESPSGAPPVLELHLLDFRGNVYGKQIEIFFVARLRAERRFASTQKLCEQMTRDVACAREVLARTAARSLP